MSKPQPVTPPDLERTQTPLKALFAISHISAVLGQEITTYQDHGVAWGRKNGPDYVAYFDWHGEGKFKLTLDPCDDSEWALAYALLGYAAYHGFEGKRHRR